MIRLDARPTRRDEHARNLHNLWPRRAANPERQPAMANDIERQVNVAILMDFMRDDLMQPDRHEELNADYFANRRVNPTRRRLTRSVPERQNHCDDLEIPEESQF